MTRDLRYPSYLILALSSCMVLLVTGCLSPRTPVAPAADPHMTLSAGQASAVVESSTGRLTSIRLGDAGEEMCQAHPAGGDQPFAFVEIKDLRTGRTFSPVRSGATIRDWRTQGRIDGAQIEFTQTYPNAPFEVYHLLKETPEGIRWEAVIHPLPVTDRPGKALPDELPGRSLQVTWVLPVPTGWQLWAPNDTVAFPTNGITPYRFIYGHTDPSPHSLVIPLVGVWGRHNGAAVFSPPDVRKCQIMFEVAAQDITDMPRGGLRHTEDLQSLRVTHGMVGLRPDKDLRLAVCLAGTRNDWRSVIGHYARAYPDLFEPIPQTRKYEGSHRTAHATRFGPKELAYYRDQNVTDVELHTHFSRYGEYLPAGAADDPNKTWFCQPHNSGQQLSVARNRQIIKALNEANIGTFLYFYNVHAQPDLVQEKFPDEVMRGEDGRVNIQYQGEPALVAQPDSPFGRNLLDQIDQLLKTYDEAPGIFLDNYSIQWVDFAHDDGVTMIHHRPAYDLNRNHQDVGTACMSRIHKAGKVTMVNKLASIESARGADMVLLEPFSVDEIKMLALACAYRPVFPTEGGSSLPPEQQMQQLLIWGGLPAQALPAYRPLTDALIGKRWVFDADPVTLPHGYAGQIFRIDRSAPAGGDVVVTLVNSCLSYKDRQFTEGLNIAIRLRDIDQFTKATWISAERSDQKPEPCSFDSQDGQMVVHLPLVGAAGVLRLSR